MLGFPDWLSVVRPGAKRIVGRAVAGVVAMSMLATGIGVGVGAYASDGGAAGANADTGASDDAAAAQNVQSAPSGQTTQTAPGTPAAAVVPYALGDHTVQGVSPNGTTINAFDYWLDDRNAADTSDPANWSGIGINQGRQLKFYSGSQGSLPSFNAWTGSTAPRTGMVYDTLKDGYPELRQSNTLGITKDESLAYLFNDAAHAGKAAYMDTQGLLQVDDDGYYYYNANRDAATAPGNTFQSANFATLDTSATAKNKWTLYDTWGVRASDAVRDSQNGQFFPFNSASDVLQENGGSLTPTNATSVSSELNHHFGLSMSSRFVQPNGGRIEKTQEDMQYHFSGDDDVWVYIDGVLVGDLGGIHIASSLDIDFRTGDVSVNGNSVNTLKGLYDAAGQSDATKWSGNTFADGTYHTLNFFYLERGGSDSNMSLKFNLKTIPESVIHKVDQENEPVRDAEFTLYTVDADYTSHKVKVGSGATDASGTLVLQDADRKVVSFDDLHTRGFDHYILEETKVPAGYRKPADATGMHLRYVEDPNSTSGTKSGVLLSVTVPSDPGSLWHTGSLALSKVTTTAPTIIRDTDGKAVDPSKGLMFAVVLKRDKSKPITDTDAWHGVVGNQLDGWKYEQSTGMKDVVDTFRDNGGANTFALTTGGGWEVTVENLPGNIERYYYMLPDNQKEQTEYTVAYYYADGAKSVDDVTAAKTRRLDFSDADDPFVRQFSANFYVSNVKNELDVQKVDKDGRALGGGEFSLYRLSDSVTGDGVDCSAATLGTAYDTLTTIGDRSSDPRLRINGTAAFPSADDKILESGTYCLVETKAPAGYLRSDVKTKVIVNDYGVFVDAGTGNDGLKVLRGAGWLVRPMSSFAASGDVDSTLTWIKSAPKSIDAFNGPDGAPNVTDAAAPTGTVKDGEVTISESSTSEPLHLKYDVGDGAHSVLKYGYSSRESNGPTLFAFDEGFGVVGSTQDAADTNDNGYNEDADRTGLLKGETNNKVDGTNPSLNADVRLGNVVTGSVIAQFTDPAESTLKISNAVEGFGANPDPGAAFGFTITLAKGANMPPLASSYTYKVCTTDTAATGGYRDCGDSQSMQITAGSGTLNLKNGQIAVFEDLPETTHYTMTETSIPENFRQKRVESWDSNATTIAPDESSGNSKATGATQHKADRHAHFINTYGSPATAKLQALKTVNGADWNPADHNNAGFTFTLMRTDHEQGTVTYGNGQAVTEMKQNGTVTAHTNGTIQAGESNSQAVMFPELTFGQTGTYTFTVTERQDNVPGWQFDDSSFTATVTVSDAQDPNTGLVATVTYATADGEALPGGETKGVPNFTNTYVAVAALPLTGGPASARDWLLAGLALAGAALASGLGYERWRRSRMTA